MEVYVLMLMFDDVYCYCVLYWNGDLLVVLLNDDLLLCVLVLFEVICFDGLLLVFVIGVEYDLLCDDVCVYVEWICVVGGVVYGWMGEGLVYGCWCVFGMSL